MNVGLRENSINHDKRCPKDIAAVTVQPECIEDIKAAMEETLDNKDMQQELKEKGLIRATDFSWKKTAEETLGVYKQVLRA